MFERFTERARQVIVLARQVGREEGHSLLLPEHLLVGLVREEEGLAARVLASRDIDEKKAMAILTEATCHSVSKPQGDQGVPMGSDAEKALELALREALSLGHNYIGTEHILLGMIRGQMVFKREVAEVLRGETLRMLSGPQRSKPEVAKPIEFCRDCRDEMSVEDMLAGTPVKPAEYLIWGKLFKPEALGPKCYDHAAKHVGHRALTHTDQYAVLDLRKLRRK